MIGSFSRPEGVTLRVFLLRHGAPEGWARGRCYGKLDVGLSEEGRREIARAARSSLRADIEAIYCSPSRRAFESAAILAGLHGVAPVCDARFGEIDFGKLEGMTYQDAAERFPELYREWMARPTEVSFPEGESFSQMKARVLEALAELRERHRDASIGLVSHGGVNRIVLAEALGVGDRDLFRIEQSYAGLSVVDYHEDCPVVRLVNGVPS